MENTNRRSTLKTLAIVAFAVVGAIVACAALVDTSAYNTELVANQQNQTIQEVWASWKKTYHFNFGSAEDSFRMKIFTANYETIEAHNANKSYTWTMKLTPFTHLTSEEFSTLYMGLDAKKKQPATLQHVAVQNLMWGAVDWVSRGAVTGVKNQGQCGSCWSFSTTGAIEGLLAVSGRGCPSLSEQQLVDCSRSYGNNGCNGGVMDYAFNYVKDHGLSYDSEYPYVAVDQSCRKDYGEIKINGHVDIPYGNTDSLHDALMGRPIAIGVDAGNWQHYGGGVFNACGSSIDHGVLLVGFDGAWKVKNSWTAGWGEGGYIRLADGNTCAIANMASYPTF